jgi:iron-sulfur cluster repair protein YtfE (RIC family)
MQLQEDQTVREIVAFNPGAARVFEKFRIDYCGGGKAFGEACSSAKANVAEVADAPTHTCGVHRPRNPTIA